MEDDAPETTTTPMAPLCRLWLKKINLAIKHKRRLFTRQANEAMHFFNGDLDWIYGLGGQKKGAGLSTSDDDVENVLPPSFQMFVNKVSELRDLFGPALYHRNPNIICEPHDPPIVPPEALGIMPPAPPPPAMPGMAQPPMDSMAQQQMQEYQQVIQMQQQQKADNGVCCGLMQYLLNFLQRDNDKKKHGRWCIDEAIIKGMGLLWHEVVKQKWTDLKSVGSFYDSVDNLIIDPDAERWEDVLWIARRCRHPFWQVEEEYGLEAGSLKQYASHESADSQSRSEPDTAAGDDGDAPKKRKGGKSNDLLEYWKVYSKQGMGDKLSDAPKPLRGAFDEFGDYCFLVVAHGVKYALNIGPQFFADDPATLDKNEDGESQVVLPREPVMQPMLQPVMQPVVDPMSGQPAFGPDGMPAQQPAIGQDGQPVQQPVMGPDGMPQEEPVLGPDGQPETKLRSDLFTAAQWPIPFWCAGDWPFESLAYDEVPNQVWPRSYIKKGMGELRFIGWCMSFLAAKIRKSCQTTVAVVKAAGEDLKSQLLSGQDYKVLELEKSLGTDIKQLVTFLEHPPFHADIWKVLSEVIDMFERRTGLTELIYGMSAKQMRSAEEANVKQQNTSIRPDDMANKTEDFLSRVAAKEGMAARWFLDDNDVLPALGPAGAHVWQTKIMTSDIERVVREFNYRIEAGSARKPNKDTQMQQATQATQVWGPIYQAYMVATGDVGPINALSQFWAAANDTTLPLLKPPPPQGLPGPPNRNGNAPKPSGAPARNSQGVR